ncbi:MAG: DNA (cytosine-5-)-methyltransferase [Epulopiscium sp. Nuni2H_MBin001]|nr:MAG: DNA (cytosine-5-)-methyltransferase [Epulopiscium sp. Nuni2H_MBin001]
MINVKNSKILKGKKFIDLFAGLGGFRIALESLGAECIYSSEIDTIVAQVYYNNFGDYPDGDITKVDAKSIPDHDILCAGFPCQAFSISGKKLGFEDSRGTSFFEVARIVKDKKPSIVFMENVKNFVTHDSGKTLQVVKSIIEDLGYTFFYKVLNATHYGIPQKRERIYMVCFRKDLGIDNFDFPTPFKLDHYVEDFLMPEDAIPSNLYVNRSDIFITDKEDNTYRNKAIRLGTVNKGGQGERIYSTKGVAITISAQGGGIFAKTGGYMINGKYRRLHPIECARLMGFPDTYKICGNRNQAYQQFGNSVVIDIIQYIAIQFAHIITSPPEKYEQSRIFPI